MTAYYNEFDPFAAEWLRQLIKAGHIAPGVVDERSIEDVQPEDLREFTQCHFFAGIGVWSYALRRAGWPDDRPIWTGSCPCQPFSAAGKGDGFDDERHLWPAWYHLVAQHNPPIIVGEQVASKATEPWFDLVQADLEAMDYAFGCVPFPSASVGAPHMRDRAFWVADADPLLSQAIGGSGQKGAAEYIQVSGLANPNRDGCSSRCETAEAAGHGDTPGAACGDGGLGNPIGVGRQQQPDGCGSDGTGVVEKEREQIQPSETSGHLHHEDPAGPTNGYWRDADWLFCRDGKWRPVEPGTFPLVDGATNRVGRLRGYGNAINAEAAQAFIECVMTIDATVIRP